MKADVRLVKKGSSKVKAFVSVTFEKGIDTECSDITVNGCKVIESNDGLFVAFPTQSYEKDGETKYSNIVFVDDGDYYDEICDQILDEYEFAVKSKKSTGRKGSASR